MSMKALYCRPSDILTDGATVTLTAGTADANYPLTNVYDRKSHTVFKSTGTTATIRATFGASKTLQAVAFINTNATGITLSNGAGLSETVSIPTTPADTLHLDPWIDLRTVANTASTTWDVALTGPTGVALGELLLVQTVRTLPILWGMEETESEPAIVHETDYGVELGLGLGVRQRGYAGSVHRETARVDLVSLQRDALGRMKGFLFVRDENVNDAMYMVLATDVLKASQVFNTITNVDFVLREQQKGWL